MSGMSPTQGETGASGPALPRTMIITGGSDGIGAAAASHLAQKGHEVVIVGRSPEKTRAVAEGIGASYWIADFADLGAVRELAADLTRSYPRIDVLANNAGGVFGARENTLDGFERTLQINHLAPFLLTHLLMPTLIRSKAVVVQTSSIAARLYGRLDVDDLQNNRHYSANKAYGDSKLANILFTRELERRFRGQGIRSAAFHPGLIGSSFAKGTNSLSMKMLYANPLTKRLLKTPADGADQLIWLADSPPTAAWRSGSYFEKRAIATRVNPQANDTALAQALWNRTLELL